MIDMDAATIDFVMLLIDFDLTTIDMYTLRFLVSAPPTH